MPAIGNIALTDGADTHTFKPRGVDNSGVATLKEGTGVPIGDKRITLSRPRTANGREKVVMKMTIPIVQDVVVSGVSRPTVVRSAYADLTLSFDETSNMAERTTAINLLHSLIGNGSFVGLVVDLDTLY